VTDHHPLSVEWRSRAAQLTAWGALDAAQFWTIAADELDAYEESHGSELLTLDEAARESGYHKDSISRMITEGKLPDGGTKGAPRVRRRDLPRKPPSATPSRTSTGGPNLVGASLADQGIVSAEP
jgi:hypothetical protein